MAIYGAKGLAYIKVNDATKPGEEGLQSPIVKFMPRDSSSATTHIDSLSYNFV